MIAVDTNVLIQAHREESPDHELAIARLEALATGDQPWAIPVFCLTEFVRVVTHPKVFDPPTPLAEAIAALEGLLQSPTVELLSPGPRFPRFLFRTMTDGDARGNLVFDAQIAAVCLEHGATDLISLDRDFERFAGIRQLGLAL